jgi:hypothetical protein
MLAVLCVHWITVADRVYKQFYLFIYLLVPYFTALSEAGFIRRIEGSLLKEFQTLANA